MKRHSRYLLALIALLTPAAAFARDAGELPEGFDKKRHMTISEVKPGMKGYGLSVFHGVEPEPFDVEVISVEHGFQPGKAVVWVRCTDERMQKSGPVSGMSGSPIYLWGENEMQKAGEGGRMIGAFAFGFGWGKDCYAGIQPIEQMIAAAARAPEKAKGDAQGIAHNPRLVPNLLAQARQFGQSDQKTWRLRHYAALYKAATKGRAKIENKPDALPPLPSTMDFGDARPTPQRLSIPVMVGSDRGAKLLQPYFKAHNLTAVAGRSSLVAASGPPQWLRDDAKKTRLKPGSVISVPIAQGAADLPAVGTVTEVLADGTVLGFGHAFMGQGEISAPMATGFVHFIQPSYGTSFKLGGTLDIVGALTNDEFAAIVGKPKAAARMVPVTVDVDWPAKSKSGTFKYEVSDLPAYQAQIVAYVGVLSLAADTELPRQATLITEATMKFAGDREMTVRGVTPFGSSFDPFFQIAPVVGSLTENPFKKLNLESVKIHLTVVEEVRQKQIINARLRNPTVKPGETLVVDLELMPYRGEKQTRTIRLDIPQDIDAGTYPLMIGGPDVYASALMSTRPYLGIVENLDDLFAAMKTISQIPDDRLYAAIRFESSTGVAVGRTPLNHLPPSRQTIIAGSKAQTVTPIMRLISQDYPSDDVIAGRAELQITVKKD